MVQIVGNMRSRFTVVTDGLTARVKDKPVPGAEPQRGRGWPQVPARLSPWPMVIPVSIAHGQSLVCDGNTARVNDRPAVPAPDQPPQLDFCMPVGGATVNPPGDSFVYNVGDTVNFTIINANGTRPFTYEWFLNGASVSTSAIFTHTFIQADVVDPDPVTGRGHFTVYCIVRNACNPDGDIAPEQTYIIQGEVPP